MLYIDEFFLEGNKKYKPLSKEEERKLFQELANGSTEAREKLIRHNIRFVIFRVTHKFKTYNYDKNDLISAGIIGLIKAVDTFDLSKDFKFSSYAVRCIDNEILMFLRKLKRHQIVESIDKEVYENSLDSNELSLKDMLCDDTNIAEDYEKAEACKIVRKLVENLPDLEKEIMMLHFGFYDRIYNQVEIAKKFKLSQSYISRVIKRVLKKLGEGLDNTRLVPINQNQPALSNEEKESVSISEANEEKKLDIESTEEQVIPNKVDVITSEENAKGKDSLLDTKPSKEPIPALETEELTVYVTKNDCLKMLEMLRTPTFAQMINILTAKEVIIIFLRFGYIDGKFFTTEAIAQFLEIKESEVIDVIKTVLQLYKKNINNYLDSVTEMITDANNRKRVMK